MKSISQISDAADAFRLELANNRALYAEILTEKPGATVAVKEIAKRAETWRQKTGQPITTGLHPVRRQMQAWGYDIQPDPETWAPILHGYSLKLAI